MLLADSHLDLGWSALHWNRDLRLPLEEIRRIEVESGCTLKGAGNNTVCLPAMREANLCLSFATVLTWVNMPDNMTRGFNSQEQAYADGMTHIYYYRVLEAEGLVRIIEDRATLDAHMAEWEAWEKSPAGKQPPLGFVIAMEGADPIVGPWQVETWWKDGLRAPSLVHYGIGPYGHGHDREGGLTPAGRELLKEFERVGMILDITHLSDQSFWEAVELFSGPLMASHHTCRALVPDPRQLSDEQITYLIGRGTMIGVAFDDWMLYPNWPRRPAQPGANQWVSIDDAVNHIDHICQLAGNSLHAGIGSDLDGGYGTEQTPRDLNSIVDLQKIPDLLRRRGYKEADIENIMYRNWARFLGEAWA
jgi:membrane dipeptidase